MRKLTLLLLTLTACKHTSASDVLADSVAPVTLGSWGPEVFLRDANRLPNVSTGPGSPVETLDGGVVVSETVAVDGMVLVKDGETPAADTQVLSGQDAGGHAIKVKRVQQTFTIPMQDGGWWVSPIHTVLLPATGDVLITGWGRAMRDRCEELPSYTGITMGLRRYGATFRFHPYDLAPAPGTLAAHPTAGQLVADGGRVYYVIQPIPEGLNPNEGDYQRQALYCSGQVPLADGRILFTGGSKYKHLGVKNMYKQNGAQLVRDYDAEEIEFGLDYAKIFDPKTGAFTALLDAGTNYAADLGPQIDGQATNTMWYPTNTRLPDGRVVTIGGFYRWGDEGVLGHEIANRSIQAFDPLAYDCLGGAQTGCDQHGKVWAGLSAHEMSPIDLKPGIRDFIHSFLLYEPVTVAGLDYQMAMSGYPGHWYLFNTDPLSKDSDAHVKAKTRVKFAPQPFTDHGAASNEANVEKRKDGAEWSSTSALLPTGEIMTVGGSGNTVAAQRADIYNPYPDCANIKELAPDAPCKRWRYVNTGIVRESAGSVLLPDGRVFLVNGWRDGQNFEADGTFHDDPRARMTPQIIDPGVTTDDGRAHGYFDATVNPAAVQNLQSWATGTTGALGDDELERGYHSWALLLKDASILIGGGADRFGDVGCERPSVQVFRPPYLDDPAARPRFATLDPWKDALTMAVGGAAIAVDVAGPALKASKPHGHTFGVSGVVLMAPGAFTHGFNQNQRYVGLSYTLDGQTLHIEPPASGTLAPPGEYLLFLVSASGVPSDGMYVKLGSGA